MKTTFFDIENWKEIGQTLARNKTRTFLTGFGIFWGTAMLAILLGGARGAQDLMRRNFAGFATNTAGLYSQRTTLPYKGHAKGRAWEMTTTDLQLLANAVPEIEAISSFDNLDIVRVASNRQSQIASVNSADENYTRIMEPVIYGGRFINSADVANGRKVAVVGRQLAGKLYPTDPMPIGKDIYINDIVYKIVGIAGQTSEININGQKIDEVVFIPSSTFRRAFNYGNRVKSLVLMAKEGTKIKDIMTKIRPLLYSHHAIHPADSEALSCFDISEMFEMAGNLFSGLSLLALFIGISTLLAGVIGIGNIMWVIVKERTQEIGIRRALGAKPRDIIVQILSEGMALTAVAGLAGISFAVIALGITQTFTANEVSTPHFQMSPVQAASIFITFSILGVLAALIPAIKAMKIKPIEALNDK